jgi:hypothetical protein
MSMLPALLALIGIPLIVYALAFRSHRRDVRAGLDADPVVSTAVRLWAYQQVLVPLLALLALAAIAGSYFLHVAWMSPPEREAFLRRPPSLQEQMEESQRKRLEEAARQHPASAGLPHAPERGAVP